MANKASLISTINGFITAVINTTKHRDSMLELINVFYSTVKKESASAGVTNGANTITSTVNPSITYELHFKKEGNKVFVSGWVLNSGALTLASNTVLFSFTDSEYLIKTGTYYLFNVMTYSGTKATLRFDGANVMCFQALPKGTPFIIDTYYYIND